MTPEQQEIQSLKKQLWRAKRDNEILKKGLVIDLDLVVVTTTRKFE
jgi:transposase-like protein